MPTLLNKPYYAPMEVTPPSSVDTAIVLLLHGDGTGGSTSLPDSSSYEHSQLIVGATVDVADKQLGTGSIAGGDASWLYSPTMQIVGNFTFDFWLKRTGNWGSIFSTQLRSSIGFPPAEGRTSVFTPTTHGIYVTTQYTGSSLFQNRLGIGIGQLGNIGFGTQFFGPIKYFINPSGWNHYAMVRESGMVTVYENGISVSTFANSDVVGDAFLDPFLNSLWAEWRLDEVRLTDDVRWTANFTPPTEPYTTALQITVPVTMPTTWDSSTANGVSLSEGDLRLANGAASSYVRSVSGKSSGKWYMEWTHDQGDFSIGIGSASFVGSGNYVGTTASGVGIFTAGTTGYSNPVKYNNVAQTPNVLFGAGDTIGIAFDLDLRQAKFISAESEEIVSLPNVPEMQGPFYIWVSETNSSGFQGYGGKANFGQSPFVYNVPAGYHEGFGDE